MSKVFSHTKISVRETKQEININKLESMYVVKMYLNPEEDYKPKEKTI